MEESRHNKRSLDPVDKTMGINAMMDAITSKYEDSATCQLLAGNSKRNYLLILYTKSAANRSMLELPTGLHQRNSSQQGTFLQISPAGP